jgi:hypothetical protein
MVSSATSLTARVPVGAITGTISVTTVGGTGTSKKSFTVTNALIASSTNTVGSLQLIEKTALTASPNPFSSKTVISLILLEEGKFTLSLFDNKGVLIQIVKEGQAKAGELIKIELDESEIAAGRGLAEGTYILKLQSRDGIEYLRLINLK